MRRTTIRSAMAKVITAGTLLLGLSHVSTAWADQNNTINVIDDRGVSVDVPRNPKRIASVSYFASDVALAFGLQPVATTFMVEGRDPEFLGGYLKQAIQIGQRATPNLELLAEAKPDLIIAIRRYTEGNATQLQKIAPYIAYNLELFTDSDRTITQLGTILKKPERAKHLNDNFRAKIKEYAENVPKDIHPRFVVMWGGDTPWTFHSENMTAAILVALGGDNIAGQNPTPHIPDNWGMEMSLEVMLERDPEVIFVYDYGPDRPHENNPIWNQLTAVKNNQVYYVGDHWVESHGPIAREMVLQEAASLLYPNVFPKVNVKAEATKLIQQALQE